MKITPLTHKHRELGARMIEFAGYEMPVEYSGVIKEHLTVRHAAGIFDVSHMGEFWVKGKGSLELLQYITTNDISALDVGQAQYSCLPNGNGGIVDDLIIYRYETDKYMLVVNASNIDKDWQWINLYNTYGAGLENASEDMSLVAIQGPRAAEILQPLVNRDLSALPGFHFCTGAVGSLDDMIVSATGYTGAGGFELYCHNEKVEALWDMLLGRGKAFGLQPAGLAARDTLRLEMGYCLYGNDIDETTSPIEAGLGWIVKLKSKGDFIDREIIERQSANGVTRKLVGLEMIDRGIPRKDYIIFNRQRNEIGKITSGTMSPTLKKGIGMSYIHIDEAQSGNEVYVQVRNKYLRAMVVQFPFIKNQ